MARARRRKSIESAEGQGTPLAGTMPEVCPVCRDTPAFPDDIAAHLQTHAPVAPCRNCGEKHVGWKVDWDGVTYPRPDVSLFFCDPCGVFAPIEASPEH